MHRIKSDKGDVPGWVLITLMTAGLIVLSQNRVISVLLFCRNPSRWMPHFSFMSPELRRRQTKTSDHNPSKSESNRNPVQTPSGVRSSRIGRNSSRDGSPI